MIKKNIGDFFFFPLPSQMIIRLVCISQDSDTKKKKGCHSKFILLTPVLSTNLLIHALTSRPGPHLNENEKYIGHSLLLFADMVFQWFSIKFCDFEIVCTWSQA